MIQTVALYNTQVWILRRELDNFELELSLRRSRDTVTVVRRLSDFLDILNDNEGHRLLLFGFKKSRRNFNLSSFINFEDFLFLSSVHLYSARYIRIILKHPRLDRARDA